MGKKVNWLKRGFVFFMLFFTCMSFYFYQIFFETNVNYEVTSAYFYIRQNDTFQSVVDRIHEERFVDNRLAFAFVGKLLNYDEMVKPGKYRIEKDMTNIDLIRMLRNGSQQTVRVTFNNLRTKQDIAKTLGAKIEADPNEIFERLNDQEYVAKYGFDTFSIVSMFIPNTYEYYWNTNTDQLFDKMKKEYDSFWTTERIAQADKIGLSLTEVSTLASIAEAEQRKRWDERSKIAGVYMNRLRIGMALQADPTLVFAHQDFTIHRVRKGHKEIDSPYNTYKYGGLPPGPINTPSIKSIDAVLNYESHKYLYFCAIGDGSGLHNFATNFETHMLNARKYQRKLNKANIE